MISPERWLPADGLRLEPNALTAARETERSLALTAGPGAGKTEMLAQRADFLLRTGMCRYPQRILAISFKVDASLNLKQRVLRRCGPELTSRFDSHTFHGFGKRLIDRFRPVLTGADALNTDYTIGERRIQGTTIEFRDLVLLALRILQANSMVRNSVRQTYSHVFLDEFQDCNNEQYELICSAFLGSGALLTAVGDTKQRIMGWAGALEGIFSRFAIDFGARALNLYQNFRSAPRLRRMQNAMVKVMDPQAAVADAELVGSSGEVRVLTFQNEVDEAKALAREIHGWIGIDGLEAAEIAVLVSRQVDLYAAPLMQELSDRGISVRNEQQLQDLLAEPAARLIIDLLYIVCGEREPEAYRRLTDLVGGWDEESNYTQHTGWSALLDALRGAFRSSTAVGSHRLTEILEPFLAYLGPERIAALSADYEHGNRFRELISQTVDRIAQFSDESNGDTLRALRRFSGADAVRILTIHKAKGLEFHTVVLLGVENQMFWGNVVNERSAYFVGISRAKQCLVLTTALSRSRPEGFSGRWDQTRTPQEEFLNYAAATF